MLFFIIISALLVSSTNCEEKKDSSKKRKKKKSITVLSAGEERAVSLTISILLIFPVYSESFWISQNGPDPNTNPPSFFHSFTLFLIPHESVSASALLCTQLEQSALINLCLHLKSRLRWCKACLYTYLQSSSRLTAQPNVPTVPNKPHTKKQDNPIN